MNKRYSIFALAILVAVVGCSSTATKESSGTGSDGEAAAAGTTFAKVQPILTQNCIGCHGETKPKEGINLTTYASVMKGGKEGPAVKPGDPEGSLLARVLRAKQAPQMPPDKALPEDQIALLEAWIKDGAKE